MAIFPSLTSRPLQCSWLHTPLPSMSHSMQAYLKKSSQPHKHLVWWVFQMINQLSTLLTHPYATLRTHSFSWHCCEHHHKVDYPHFTGLWIRQTMSSGTIKLNNGQPGNLPSRPCQPCQNISLDEWCFMLAWLYFYSLAIARPNSIYSLFFVTLHLLLHCLISPLLDMYHNFDHHPPSPQKFLHPQHHYQHGILFHPWKHSRLKHNQLLVLLFIFLLLWVDHWINFHLRWAESCLCWFSHIQFQWKRSKCVRNYSEIIAFNAQMTHMASYLTSFDSDSSSIGVDTLCSHTL